MTYINVVVLHRLKKTSDIELSAGCCLRTGFYLLMCFCRNSSGSCFRQLLSNGSIIGARVKELSREIEGFKCKRETVSEYEIQNVRHV